MSLEELWRQKSDHRLEVAAKELSNYTEEAEQVIRAEIRRRGMPEPPISKRRLKPNKDTKYYKRIKETSLALCELLIGLFGLLVGLPVWLVGAAILLVTLAGQISGIVVGSLMIWSSISSALRGQASFTYISGYHNPLPLFKFNPGLGNFCLGWGILYSVIIAWRKEPRGKVYFVYAAIFGIANLIVGLINLFTTLQSDIGIHLSGLLASIFSFFMGLSIVITILQSWESKN